MADINEIRPIRIVERPCGSNGVAVSAAEGRNWEETKKALEQVAGNTEEINEELIYIDGTIIQIINGTIINIFQTTTGATSGRVIEFELLEDNDGATPADVLKCYNGGAPASPVEVLDPTDRWPDAKVGALGMAFEAFDGVTAVWIIDRCQQLVRYGDSVIEEDTCGSPGPIPIGVFVPHPDGEYVQEPNPPPEEVFNPKAFAGVAGTPVSLRRVGEAWEIESMGLSELEQLSDVACPETTFTKTFTTVRGYGCGSGDTTTEIVFEADDCAEEPGP